MNYVLNHPWLLGLVLPPVLAAIPGWLVKAERAALAKLFAYGDPADQEAIKATFKVWVQWAEKKYNIGGQGPAKLDAVAAVVAHAFPFIPADERARLIEEAVKELDDAARASLTQSPAQP